VRRTKDGLIPMLRLTVLIDKPDPDGMAEFGLVADNRPARVTLITDDGIDLGSGVIVAISPEDE
jgi:hypothetical protein